MTTPDTDDQMSDVSTEKPGIGALLSQLTDDASHFARAEVRFLQTQAEERLSHAFPAIMMVSAAAAFAFAVVTSLLVALVLALAPFVGIIIAVLIIAAISSIAAFALFRLGRTRMHRIFRALDRT